MGYEISEMLIYSALGGVLPYVATELVDFCRRTRCGR